MRVLFVTLGYPPGDGQPTYIKNLFLRYLRRRVDTIVLTTKSEKRIRDKRIWEVPYKGHNPLIFIVIAYFYLLLAKRKEKFDIIHGNAIDHLLFILYKRKNIIFVSYEENMAWELRKCWHFYLNGIKAEIKFL